MKTVGIIAEFNPFHCGHEYIINEAKRISGADRLAVIRSRVHEPHIAEKPAEPPKTEESEEAQEHEFAQ